MAVPFHRRGGVTVKSIIPQSLPMCNTLKAYFGYKIPSSRSGELMTDAKERGQLIRLPPLLSCPIILLIFISAHPFLFVNCIYT
jgi:hypothetical protein